MGPDADARVLFALGLGMAALFHLAGNARPSFSPPDLALTSVQLGVGATALWTCFRPRVQLPLLLLCGLIPMSAWLEAPVVGNHWVLAAALSTTYLLAGVAGGFMRERRGAGPTWSRFLPAGRAVLLIAYGMASFAKLNTDFFDPVTSCAVFYQHQLVRSWGLERLSSVGHPVLGRGVALGASLVELSVPLLLLIRRTRRAGILLALSFHWLIALDLDQHFWDFSSVLFVAFLLFLDRAQVVAVVSTLRGVRSAMRTSVRLLVASVGVVMAGAVTASAALTGNPPLRGTAVLLGHLAWFGLGTAVLFVVAAATGRTAPDPERLVFPAVAVLLVPALVALKASPPTSS